MRNHILASVTLTIIGLFALLALHPFDGFRFGGTAASASVPADYSEPLLDACVRTATPVAACGEGRSVAETSSDCIAAVQSELDWIVEGPGDAERAEIGLPVLPTPSYVDIAAACDSLGSNAALVSIVGPAYAACEYEDGSGAVEPCFWDASTAGNGTGVSFIAYPWDYVSDTVAVTTWDDGSSSVYANPAVGACDYAIDGAHAYTIPCPNSN